MTRRIFAGFTAAAMSLTLLTGCSTGYNQLGSALDENNTSADDIKITMCIAARDEFLSAMEQGSKDNVPAGVTLDTQDAQSDAAKQMQQIEAARNKGANAIIINLVDPETASEMKAAAGDCKVIFVNRFPSDPSVLDENAAYVGSDENTSGKFQGEWLAAHFKAQGKTDIQYVLINGILGQDSVIKRTKSVLQALNDNGIRATEATAPLVADWDRAKAMDKFAPLVGNTDYDCVISNNDSMALGIIELLESKNLDPSEKPIVGIDATPDGCAAVKAGKMSMTVFQDPIGQGKGAITAAINLVKGNDLAQDSGLEKDETGHILWVPFEPVTKENAAHYS